MFQEGFGDRLGVARGERGALGGPQAYGDGVAGRPGRVLGSGVGPLHEFAGHPRHLVTGGLVDDVSREFER